MPHFAARQVATSPEFRLSRLLTGYVLLGILMVCAPRSAAGAPPTTTTTTLSVSPSGSVAQGTVLTLQATVSAAGSPVSGGSVTFYDGTTALASAQVVNATSTYTLGTANLKLRLGLGAHVLKAVYAGVTAYQPSTSATQTVTVTSAGAAATNTAITSTGSAGNYTLKGTVTALSSASPTGNVSFLDQSNSGFSLGTAALDPSTKISGFGSLAATASGYGTFGVAIGDLNGDGIPDVATADYLGSAVSVLLGNGDGTYLTHVDYSLGTNIPAFGLALGDVNGDGYLDIVAAIHNNSGIYVLLGNGDGTFQAPQLNATTGSSNWVALADLNKDGNLDIVTLDYYSDVVIVFLGNGDGTFQKSVSYDTGSTPYGVTVGDFNKDGKVDVAVSNYGSATVSVLLGNGDGTLQAQTAYTVDQGPMNLIAVDLDNDGNQDLVVCDYSGSMVSVLLGNGDGTFKAQVEYPVSSPWGLAAADLNGDGFIDVVAVSPGAAFTVLQGVGDGTFQPPVSTATGGSTFMVALGDLNGDGVTDLVLSDLGNSNILVSLSSISVSATLAGVSIPGGGTHNVVADYARDVNSAVSMSSPIELAGSAISTSLSVNVSPNPASLGQSVALTATITPGTHAGYTSTGTVTFYDDGTPIGSPVTVSNGHAVLTKSDLAVGDHDITAVYSGDTNFTGSTAAAATLTVSLPDYTITASPSALTIHRGQAGSSTLTVTPTGGYTGSLAFSCSGLPAFATCTFSPASLQLDGSNTAHTVQFKVHTGLDVASMAAPSSGAPARFGRMPVLALLTPLFALSLLSITRRRTPARPGRSRWLSLRWLHMLVLATLFLGVAGCGGSSTKSEPQSKVPLGTSSVVVTATAVGGGATHSATILVTIVQ
jgi:hypothetical protein